MQSVGHVLKFAQQIEFFEVRLMKSSTTKLLWFIGLYVVGVVSVGGFVWLARLLLGLHV